MFAYSEVYSCVYALQPRAPYQHDEPAYADDFDTEGSSSRSQSDEYDGRPARVSSATQGPAIIMSPAHAGARSHVPDPMHAHTEPIPMASHGVAYQQLGMENHHAGVHALHNPAFMSPGQQAQHTGLGVNRDPRVSAPLLQQLQMQHAPLDVRISAPPSLARPGQQHAHYSQSPFCVSSMNQVQQAQQAFPTGILSHLQQSILQSGQSLMDSNFAVSPAANGASPAVSNRGVNRNLQAPMVISPGEFYCFARLREHFTMF